MSKLSPQSSLFNSSGQLINRIEAKQFLRFHLDPHTKAMLPIGQITEVLKIQLGQIVPIPQMPSWVMGVYNWRGDILWTIDLGHLMGLTPWYHSELNPAHHNAIVLSPDKQKNATNTGSKINLGLVVGRIEDLESCNPSEIQSPTQGTETLPIFNFLEGYWLQPKGEMILVLNGQAIVAAMPSN